MSFNKFYIIIIIEFSFIICCKEKAKNDLTDKIDDSISLKIKDSIFIDTSGTKLKKYSFFQKNEIIAKNKNIAVSYDKDNRLVCIIYKDSIYRLGNFSNTFALPPNIYFDNIDKNIAVLIESNIIQMGISDYSFYLFELDTINKEVLQRCAISNVSTHKIENDTYLYPIFHDYKIKRKEFIINEYNPYKSDTVEYSVKKHTCTW